MIVTEKLRWVPGGKGQVAGHDRVKTTMSSPGNNRVSTANEVPSNGCYQQTPMWNTNIAFVYLKQRN
jgi:hypothetical protein